MNPLEFALQGAPESPGFAFPPPPFTIGSGPQSGLRFDARLVHPQHAEVVVDAEGVPWIRDLTNQGLVWVNGAQISEAALAVGSLVRLGGLDLEVRQVSIDEVALDSTARRPTPFRNPPLDSTAKRPTPFQSPPSVRTSQAGRISAIKQSGVASVPDVDATLMRTVLPEGSLVGGRYRIIKKLAAGGMGEVYQAEHVELHKQFAVKVMLPALSADEEFVARFKREAISASRIGQQNIIDISDFGQTDDGRFYFVMEFLDGVTIASLLHRQGPLPLQRMVNIALQTTRALAAAHAQGIVHRDMKTENVMVLQRARQPDFVKVLDFGVAKVSTGPGQGGQTQLGMVVGTPQYMSPEQAMGLAVDSRTDTYALGLILYEMLSGKPTFTGDTASILMVKQVTEPPQPFLPELAATIPATLHDLIFQMLEKDPNARPESLDAVVEVLETVLAHLQVGAKLAPASVSGRFPSTATPHTSRPVRVTSSGVPVVQPTLREPVAEPTGHEDTLSPPTKSKTPFVVAGLLALVIVSAIAVAAFKPSPVPPVPVVYSHVEPIALKPVEKVELASPQTPKTVKFKLETQPDGAEVFEKDLSLGVTPLTVNRPPGSRLDLRFVLKGFDELDKSLAVPDADETRAFELVKKRSGGGKPKSSGSGLKDLDFEQTNDLKDLE
jgi:eukaryotic-like serine/threonine-protein kinase